MPIFDWGSKAKLGPDGLVVRYAGLLLDSRLTELLSDDRELTFSISDRPRRYTTKLHHSNRCPGWTRYRQSTLALISDIDEGQLRMKSYEDPPRCQLEEKPDLLSEENSYFWVLVSVQLSKRGVLYTRYEGAVGCEPSIPSSCSSGPIFSTKTLPKSQTWYIKYIQRSFPYSEGMDGRCS